MNSQAGCHAEDFLPHRTRIGININVSQGLISLPQMSMLLIFTYPLSVIPAISKNVFVSFAGFAIRGC
jgi:hypothetical protein